MCLPFNTSLRRCCLLLIALIMVIASAPGAAARQVDPDRAAILAQSGRLSDAYVRGDIADLVAVYARNGIAAPGGRDFVRGWPALDSLWALPPGRTILRHKSTPLELRIDGDHAYDWGYYEGQAAQDGVPLAPFRGKYVIVWHRGTDGTWRILMDMWNSLPTD